MAGTRIISCSITDEDAGRLTLIKEKDGLGPTSVLRVGIQHVLEKPRIQAQLAFKDEQIKTLSDKLQKVAKRLYELENT